VNEAIRTCREALEIQSESVEVLCSLASAVLFKKMLKDEDTEPKHGLKTDQARMDQINLVKEAVILGHKILALKPAQPEAHNILGIAFKFQNEDEKAKGEFLKAIELRPEYLEAHFNLGILYLEEGILSNAAFHFYKTIEIDANFADGYKNLSKIFFLEKEYELSRGYQKRASEFREKTKFSSTNLLILGKKSELDSDR
jgi:Flp pilus assembly protein TadD